MISVLVSLSLIVMYTLLANHLYPRWYMSTPPQVWLLCRYTLLANCLHPQWYLSAPPWALLKFDCPYLPITFIRYGIRPSSLMISVLFSLCLMIVVYKLTPPQIGLWVFSRHTPPSSMLSVFTSSNLIVVVYLLPIIRPVFSIMFRCRSRNVTVIRFVRLLDVISRAGYGWISVTSLNGEAPISSAGAALEAHPGINESHDSTWTVGSICWRWRTLTWVQELPLVGEVAAVLAMAKFPSTAESYSRGGTKNHRFSMDYANEL